MALWYYLDDRRQQQPVEELAIDSLIASGRIRRDTLVWTTGRDAWEPAGDAFASRFTAVPPPVPGQAAPRAGATPPPPPRRSHEIDYEIFGDDLQIVEVELDPGETVIAEAGALNYLEDGITFETRMGDGSQPSGGLGSLLAGVGKRLLTGESLFLTHFTHRGAPGKRRVAFAAPYPGKIIPLRLAELGGELLCQKDAFLCAAMGTSVGIAFNKRFGAGLFGGEGFILQRLRGDGLAFLHAGGTLVKKELRGQKLLVDTGCLVAFTPGVSYDIQRVGGLKTMLFGGEGLFFATLEGHGTVWLQSLPFSRLADRILAHAPSAGGSAKGEGSVLGGLGRMIDGS